MYQSVSCMYLSISGFICLYLMYQLVLCVYLSVSMYLHVSVFMRTYRYVSVSIMHGSACIAYIVPRRHKNRRHVLKTPSRGAAPGGLHLGHPRACVQTLYFIGVPRGDPICAPARAARVRCP
jgi:hypothetical protein